MPVASFQRRRAGAILLAVGSLPWIGAAIVVLTAFVLPSVFGRVFDVFVPAGVDAPDNWAVAATRMIWLFIVSGGIGVIFSGAGVWLLWRRT
jgi:hypothetical protein